MLFLAQIATMQEYIKKLEADRNGILWYLFPSKPCFYSTVLWESGQEFPSVRNLKKFQVVSVSKSWETKPVNLVALKNAWLPVTKPVTMKIMHAMLRCNHLETP